MINLGFVCSSRSWGGLEMNFAKLAIWMKERGYKVFIYVVENSPCANYLKNAGIEINYINYHKKYFDFKNGRLLKALFKAAEIKLVIATDNRDLSVLAIAKSICHNSFKLIYLQQMHIGVRKKDFLHSLRYSKIDAWIAPLKSLANEVKELTNFDTSKVHVIPLGVDTNLLIKNRYEKREARKKLNINPQGILFGIIGRFDKQKGQDFLLKCISKMNASGVNADLLLLGEPTIGQGEGYFLELKNIINNECDPSRIFIRPFTLDVNLFYNSIDVFVMASDSETYGMVTVEAMLNKLPVIGSNSGGTPELLKYGELGVLYEPRNINDFINKAIGLISNPDLMQTLGDNAYEFAVNNYSKKYQCDKLIELINQIC